MIVHPIEPLYNKNSKILILGSFPSVKSREIGFFYGHSQNRFWKIIARLCDKELPTTIEQKKKLILDNKLALWDVIKSCEIVGSADSTIKNVIPNNINFIIENSQIEKIFVNGRKAEALYKKYIEKEVGIKAVCLPSTSPANASWSEDRLYEYWRKMMFDTNMKETIIQFGEGNFLRGFADYFIHKLNEQGLYKGKIVVVKPTARGSVDIFNEQNCEYNLFLRGIENEKEVCEHSKITSISRIINPYIDFQSYLNLAKNPNLRFVISNTTEAGITFDAASKKTDTPPSSYPAKLTLLLYERYKAGLNGLVIFPCELIDNNANELKRCVLKYAELWETDNAFLEWIEKENTFCNTLVDRIVTGYPKDEAESLCTKIGYTDKLLDTGEIFHLWAIEGNFENELPFNKAGFNVIWTNDVSPYKKRKVRILNGAHTSLVCAALLAGLETVGQFMEDDDLYAFMHKCIYDEIIKVLDSSDESIAFAKATEERFRNPYIRHQLRSIALNCVSKFAVRVLPSILDYKEKFGSYPPALSFSLSALLYFYKNDTPNDDKDIESFLKNSDLIDILKNADLWGADLSALYDTVNEGYMKIESEGIREAIKWIL